MNSVLNPEAPEFHPHFTTITQGGYALVNKSIRSSNLMPSGESYQLFETITDFNRVRSNLTKNVIIQSNNILTLESNGRKLKYNDTEHNTEKIIDANDNMLDRIHINIEGMGKENSQDIVGKDSNVAAWNNKPIISVVQMGSAKFIGAKNIPRPQWSFKDTIDNSENLWVPKISDKPNNIKPLALTILYNDEGEAVGYKHPYETELQLYNPPGEFVEPDSSPPEFPPPLDQTNYTYVATEEQLDELVRHLCDVKEIAVDVEHHSYRTYQGITCLIQISTSGGDFIIDALAAREHVHKLNLCFTDPRKLKVLHGAEMDVLWLQRDFGVYVVGMFDTHQAARALGLSSGSLKHLLMRYCNVDANKQYQLADWRMRPLPQELVQYARQDTHYLLYIWRRMRAELLERGAHLLQAVFDASRTICGATYKKEVVRETSHLELYVRSKKSFNSRQLAALKLLYRWRDSQARFLDESTAYLIPNHMLLALAEALPRELQGVSACCSPMPPFVKQNLVTIHRMLLSCRELPLEPQLYQMPSSISTLLNTRAAHSYSVHDLSHMPEPREELVQAEAVAEAAAECEPDIYVFSVDCRARTTTWNFNVDAKIFIPPYDRYRKYRALAQVEEIREFKEKEAKIVAISGGNELIKAEVLAKLAEARTAADHSVERSAADEAAPARKRKICADGTKQPADAQTEKLTNNEVIKKPTNHEKKATVKAYNYKNSNYKKFYSAAEKPHKQIKVKDKRK